MAWTDSLPAQGVVDPCVRTVSNGASGTVRTRTIVFTTRPGVRRAASLIGPVDQPIRAGALFLHWYEPEAVDSNRTQFEPEAALLAGQGVLSLLVETMWSDRDWFIKRTHDQDYQASLNQVIELQTAFTLLLKEAEGAGIPIVLVGHDFGAMYGVLLGAVTPDIKAFVLMAGTPRFADWYFYFPPLSAESKLAYQAQMEPIDPVSNVPELRSRPIFFQFGLDDPHVSRDRAADFAAAANEPKLVKWYGGGHALDQQARTDRLAWIKDELDLDNR
jgi:predicted esterase